ARAGLFDDALETWSEAFEVTPLGQFRTSVGGVYAIAANNVDQLIERERQATLYFKEPLASKTEFQIAEELLKFNHYFVTLSERRDFNAIPRYIAPKEIVEPPAVTVPVSSASGTDKTTTATGETQTPSAPGI